MRPRCSGFLVASFAFGLWLESGCGGALESQTRRDLDRAARAFREAAESEASSAERSFDGTLAGYLAVALSRSPEVREAFERWRAATLRISRARRLPEPTLTYGYFIRQVETRVGPQRHRFGLSQAFPWPTKLSRGADAGAATARAAQARFDARVLAMRADVAEVYWRLWLIHETHRLKSDHDAVLETLAGTIRGRVSTNQATLAELNQVELTIARHHDHRAEHHEAARAASAELFALLGQSPPASLATTADEPREGHPAAPPEALAQSALSHPRVETHGWMATASAAEAAAESADRFPGFRLGIDYIETGPARTPGVDGSGDDALMASVSVSVPLWFGSYDDAEAAAEADQRAHLAQRDANLARAAADLEIALSAVRDSERRIRLYRDTLIPQAEITYRSVLGSYQTGRATVAAALLAQRDLLELSLEYARARSDHAREWARLEFIVGQDVVTAREDDR